MMSDGENAKSDDYGAASIEVLSAIQAIRRRPGMYVGDITDPVVFSVLICLALEVALCKDRGGGATQVIVVLNADGSCEVRDDGSGLPAEELCGRSPECTKAQEFLEDCFVGRASLGVTNALSSHLQATIYHCGKIYRLAYERGELLAPQRMLGEAGGRHGNEIVFFPDPEIFKDTRFDSPSIARSLTEMANKFPAVTIILEDRRARETVREQWNPRA